MTFANCDFKSGRYIEELLNSSSVHKIKINVPKSAKYAKNLFEIFHSKEENIRPDLKKRFKAEITVIYSFGTCVFKGTIRQTGDWKDHIAILSGGRPYRSLKVNLDRGNIVSAVEFKLLIPETRMSENEILASLILKRLGIISPETFAVEVDVNGISAPMLFQEHPRKELLEKNYRREGAIYEGDEELLWSFQDFENAELKNFSLSRMTNSNWFKKGKSSQTIALSSYARLQSAYSYSATRNEKHKLLIVNPNQKDRSEFSKFMFALLAMNGWHSLLNSNRIFYFNSIMSRFEPIYYDGNISFSRLKETHTGHSLDTILSAQFDTKIDQVFIEQIKEVLNSEKIKIEFTKRVEALNSTDYIRRDFGKFYDNAISQYLTNVQILDNKISSLLAQPSLAKPTEKSFNSIANFLKMQKKHRFSQNVITKLEETARDYYIATFLSGQQRALNVKEVARVIAKNNLDRERTVFLGNYVGNPEPVAPIDKTVSFAEKLTVSAGVEVSISQPEKLLTFTQTKEDDWVLIQSDDLSDWDISFIGMKKVGDAQVLTDQRFNRFGLTGCLNFHRSKFRNTKIKVFGGKCEDSLNIINSTGSIDSILVTDAISDGLDIDFSVINISKVFIDNAGNDCLDVSGGNYQVGLIGLTNCGDKGISVGEVSTLSAKDMYLHSAQIGVASKDLSKVEILDANFKEVGVCVEVMQKKQEFGGATLDVGNFECDGSFEVDKNSVFKAELQ